MKRAFCHILFIVATGLLCILTGCDERIVYHAYQPVPVQGWQKTDTLVFHTDTITSEGDYSFRLELRSTGKYPFQSVWLIVERRSGYVADFVRDTVECRLVDSEIQRMGEGVHTCLYSVPLRPLHLPTWQPLEIRVRHYMHRETLSGLHDIGICITR